MRTLGGLLIPDTRLLDTLRSQPDDVVEQYMSSARKNRLHLGLMWPHCGPWPGNPVPFWPGQGRMYWVPRPWIAWRYFEGISVYFERICPYKHCYPSVGTAEARKNRCWYVYPPLLHELQLSGWVSFLEGTGPVGRQIYVFFVFLYLLGSDMFSNEHVVLKK